MLSKTFIYEFDPDTHLEGWRPKDQPHFTPGEPQLVAHDTLEHFANDTGVLADEVRALGALLFVRLESGYAFQAGFQQPLDEALANVTADTLADSIRASDACHLDTAPGTRPLSLNRFCRSTDSVLQRGAALAVRQLLTKFGLEDCDPEILETIGTPEFADDLLGWLRLGYRQAYRRFRGDANCARQLFTEVRDEVQRINNSYEPACGDELRVSASIANCQVRVTYLPLDRERLRFN